MDDYFKMKMLEKEGFTPYEQVKISHMQSKKASGTAIGALVVGVGAAVGVVGVAAWATAKASEARRTAAAENAGTAALLNQFTKMATDYMTEERQERRQGDITLNQTITDTISGQQQGSQSQSQTVSQDVTQQVMTGLMTGKYSENPIRVVRVSGTRECPCDNGCGCGNG